jgi:acyl-[acyl carrier protein]--UDP-N-acetylglucosamine O-acyltransferase
MGYRLKDSISIFELTSKLGLTFKGANCEIFGVSTFDKQCRGFLVFSKTAGEPLEGSVVVESAGNKSNIKYASIISENPRLDFIRLLNVLESDIGFSTYEFESKIHNSVVLGPNVVIEEGCIIGENVVIEANAVIHRGTCIGANTRIRSCSSIGSDGFGFERLDDGTPVRFPHLGGVVIGESVEIGACTAVARGTLSNTIIDSYAKIDNLVHIAHNVHVKKGAFIIACAEISGGVEVGENAWIAPNSCTHQKIKIGDGAIVGLGAVVTKDVASKTIWAGNPAKKLREVD